MESHYDVEANRKDRESWGLAGLQRDSGIFGFSNHSPFSKDCHWTFRLAVPIGIHFNIQLGCHHFACNPPLLPLSHDIWVFRRQLRSIVPLPLQLADWSLMFKKGQRHVSHLHELSRKEKKEIDPTWPLLLQTLAVFCATSALTGQWNETVESYSQ